MNLYSVDFQIAAAVYIKADAGEAARPPPYLPRFGEDQYQELPISGASYNNPDLPEISLSPAMTICVEAKDVEALELEEEGVP